LVSKITLQTCFPITPAGENQAKSDILLVVVPIVVPNEGGFWEWPVQAS
jgi:hypothetical protein